jgi:pimeloyl-ACP methyl ester carboxylesterase
MRGQHHGKLWALGPGLLVAALVGLTLYTRAQVQAIETAYSPPGQFVTVDGVRLHYVRHGVGKPVVFIHGSLGSVYDFTMSILDRAAQEYQAIAIDRPGHGYSERPGSMALSPALHASYLRGLLRAIGVERPVLVGHSWGGAVALAYALEYPDSAAGLVLLAGAAYGREGLTDPRSRVVAIPVLGEVLTNVFYLPVTQMLYPPPEPGHPGAGPLPGPYVATAQRLALRPAHFRAEATDSRELGAALRAMSPRYGEIRVPVVLVHGDADSQVPLEQHALPLHHAIPGSRLIVLPNTGHWVHFADPDRVLEAIHLAWGQAGAR